MVVSPLKVSVHGPLPEHPPPDHPVKVDPESADAVRVTSIPLANSALQVDPQSMPAGLLVTLPFPAPDLETRRAGGPSVRVDLKTPPP